MRIAAGGQRGAQIDPYRTVFGDDDAIRSGDRNDHRRPSPEVEDLRACLGNAGIGARKVLVVADGNGPPERPRHQRHAVAGEVGFSGSVPPSARRGLLTPFSPRGRVVSCVRLSAATLPAEPRPLRSFARTLLTPLDGRAPRTPSPNCTNCLALFIPEQREHTIRWCGTKQRVPFSPGNVVDAHRELARGAEFVGGRAIGERYVFELEALKGTAAFPAPRICVADSP